MRREKFAGALALALGEFAEQIFVGAAEKIRFNIVQAEPITRIGQRFDDAAQSLVADFALAATRLVEIHDVDHTRQRWIGLHDRADSRRELLAERFRFLIFGPVELFAPAYDWPTRHSVEYKSERANDRLRELRAPFAFAP